MANELSPAKQAVEKLKGILNESSVQEQFKNALKENSGPFVASIIDLFSCDNTLMKCSPNQVIMEALKAATLKLPINKQLGFAYIVPYKKGGFPIPQFQLGYKGYIQLAMRTGQYKFLNAGIVYEGQIKKTNLLTGEIDMTGEKSSDKAVGYFAYMQLLNGFSKVLYWTVDEVRNHAKRYSKTYNSENSVWKTNFDQMALKTVVRNLLSHYGILSVDMVSALTTDTADDIETQVQNEIDANANSEVIDIETGEIIEADCEVVEDKKEDSEPFPEMTF